MAPISPSLAGVTWSAKEAVALVPTVLREKGSAPQLEYDVN